MDPALLTSAAFWNDRGPVAAGDFPGGLPALPELAGQVLFASSGSSGAPKWIALSKEALRVSAAAVNRHLAVTRASCWGLALPLHHVGGFGVMARAHEAACGPARVFKRRWEAPAFVRWLADQEVSHTSLVPTQVHDVVAAGLRAPATLRAVVVGGGHLDAATGQAARALGWPVLASYGMTEACSQIATQSPAMLADIYQPWPLPVLPIWQVTSTPEQTLCLSGPALFSGMLARAGGRWVFTRRAADWYPTRDRVALANGWLTPLGRADTLVKVLGELVDPELIERELAALSSGHLVAGRFVVVAVPDARAQHALVPVFDATVDQALVAAVLAAYAQQAPGLRRLRPAVVLAEFPRGALGKPRRAAIAAVVVALDGRTGTAGYTND